MIVASQFGWHAVSDKPPAMYDLLLMGLLMSEERVGRRVRQNAGTTGSQESDRLNRLRMYSE